MTVRERILAIRLLEKQDKQSEYMKHIGVHVRIKDNMSPMAEKPVLRMEVSQSEDNVAHKATF